LRPTASGHSFVLRDVGLVESTTSRTLQFEEDIMRVLSSVGQPSDRLGSRPHAGRLALWRRGALAPAREDRRGSLLTHTHRDHCDAAAIESITKATPLYCQPEDEASIRDDRFGEIVPLVERPLECGGASSLAGLANCSRYERQTHTSEGRSQYWASSWEMCRCLRWGPQVSESLPRGGRLPSAKKHRKSAQQGHHLWPLTYILGMNRHGRSLVILEPCSWVAADERGSGDGPP
jgi:hypothetical protein